MNFRRIVAAAALAFSATLFLGCAEEKPSQNNTPAGVQTQKGAGGGRKGPPAPPPIAP
jgi:hypothetical protein